MMRREQSWRLIPRELSLEYSAPEPGLDCLVGLDEERDFIGNRVPVLMEFGLREIGTEFID